MNLDTVWPSEVVPRGGTLGNHQLEAGHMGKLMRRNYIDSCAKNMTQVNCKFLLMKSSKKCILFFTCILPDYVAHDITKEF